MSLLARVFQCKSTISPFKDLNTTQPNGQTLKHQKEMHSNK